MIPPVSAFLELCGELDVVLRQILVRVSPGVTTREIEGVASELIRLRGLTAIFQSDEHVASVFPATITTSVNEQMVNGIPSDRSLQLGDLLSIQVGIARKRVMACQGWTVPIGQPSPEDRRLLDVGRTALRRGVGAVRTGVTVFDVSSAIDATIRQAGFRPGVEFGGHCVGRALHEPPFIPCALTHKRAAPRDLAARMHSGQILSVNVFVHAGSSRTRVEPDEWTVVSRDGKNSVHFSMMVVACREGPSILTLPHDLEWRAEIGATRKLPEERPWWRRFW